MGKKTLKKIDKVLLSLTLVIAVFGLVMVFDASVAEAYALFGDKYYFLKQQSMWLGFGLIAAAAAATVPLEWLKRAAPVLMVVSLTLMVLVLLPGVGLKALGARRWLSLAGFQLQPTELAKLTLVTYLAAWLEKPRSWWQLVVILGVFLGLTMIQPDMGTALVLGGAGMVVFYVAGAPLKSLFLIGTASAAAGWGLILSSPYRLERLKTFLNPLHDPLGSSYHIRQALIAIGSGGLIGLGLGESRQKYRFLPQVTTDSIFAVIAEELGFIGTALLLSGLAMIVWRGLRIAKLAPDRFTALLAAGIAGTLAIQIFINLGAMLAILPLTGVPLPLVSYGGSSLVISLTAIGLLLNISRYQISPKKLR